LRSACWWRRWARSFRSANGFRVRLPRLPGDIVIRGKHSVFYFPLVTCLLISVVLSLALWLVNRR
jgi:hypothetical protein